MQLSPQEFSERYANIEVQLPPIYALSARLAALVGTLPEDWAGVGQELTSLVTSVAVQGDTPAARARIAELRSLMHAAHTACDMVCALLGEHLENSQRRAANLN